MGLEDELKRLLEQYAVRPSEKLGQHFLIDERVIDYIAGQVTYGAHVIEVGAGTGHLTRELAKRAGSVTTVEIDDRYEPILDDVQTDHPNVSVRYGNILDIGIDSLLQESGYNQVIANLPFHIIEPFMIAMIDQPIENAILLVGDNTAREFFEDENSRSFGRMSLLAQTFFEARQLSTVSRRSFYPPPRTDSSLVEVVPNKMRETAADPSKYIFAKLFMTASRHPLVVNIMKEALVEASERTSRGTLDRRDGWQRRRAVFRRQSRSWIDEYNRTGEISADDGKGESGGIISQDQALRKIDRMGIDDSILRRPFLRLDNQDIRELVTGVRRILE